MIAFLLSFLQFTAFVFLNKLTLPARSFALNPYLALLDNLSNRLIAFVRSGLPLSPRILCFLIGGLALAGRTALVAKSGFNILSLGGLYTYTFAPTGFIEWFGVAMLQFLAFCAALFSAYILLRLWHFGKELPGYTGDILKQALRPFSYASFLLQILALMIIAAALIFLCEHFAVGSLNSEFSASSRELFAKAQLPNLFDLSQLSPMMRNSFLTGFSIIATIADLTHFIFLLILLSLFSLLFRARGTDFFVQDALTLMQGRLPTLRIGALNLTPIVVFFLLNLIMIILLQGFLIAIWGLNHVVQTL
ncbi:MAG: hypothetical protein RSD41_02590 [Kiritimatiellia bacterium]